MLGPIIRRGHVFIFDDRRRQRYGLFFVRGISLSDASPKVRHDCALRSDSLVYRGLQGTGDI